MRSNEHTYVIVRRSQRVVVVVVSGANDSCGPQCNKGIPRGVDECAFVRKLANRIAHRMNMKWNVRWSTQLRTYGVFCERENISINMSHTFTMFVCRLIVSGAYTFRNARRTHSSRMSWFKKKVEVDKSPIEVCLK